MSLSILLTADVHLGLKFAGFGNAREALAEARFEALERVVRTGNSEGCGLLVVAGDLFDSQSVAKRDVARAASILDGFTGRLAAVLPGNHDYFASDDSQLWKAFRESAGDRTLLLDKPTVYPLQHFDIDAALYAAPCTSRRSNTNAVGWIKECGRDHGVRHHVGVAHGSLAGVSPDTDSTYFPMTRDELEALGLDLWLCGHTDRMQYPSQPGPRDRIFYPRTPEPNAFNCRHDGLAWRLKLDDTGSVTAKSIRTGANRFVHMEADISGENGIDALAASLDRPDAANTLLKLKLSGRIPASVFEKVAGLVHGLASRYMYLETSTDELRPEITRALIDERFTEGSFPHRLMCAIDADDAEALRAAMEIIEEVRA
jgi:DNA repair exonuclease SbcCD nuclease subunit